jgi:Zn-dependent protease with chaperone function
MLEASANCATSHWQARTPSAREDFFTAIARHRRAAWRITALCVVSYVVLGLVIAVLMAPLLYGVIGLALDAVNLLTPTPDLLTFAAHEFASRAASDTPHTLWLELLAALPGLALFAIAARTLTRAFERSPMFRSDAPIGRPPDPTRVAETRMCNVIEEMAIAAAIPTPQVRFVNDSVNAATFGSGVGHATLLIGARMGDCLTRAQMQAIAGHLVSSIANGDVLIGMRAALTLSAFSLAGRMAASFRNRAAFASTLRLARALVAPTTANLGLIIAQLSDPSGTLDQPAGTVMTATDSSLTWRQWVMMPLMGPLVLSGLLAGISNALLLAPLMSVMWRQRKYMADATAVRLIGDPDALDEALAKIGGASASLQIAPCAAHLCVVDPAATTRGIFGDSFIPIFPPPALRHQALVRMGATERSVQGARSAPAWLLNVIYLCLAMILGPLLLAMMISGAMASMAASGLFTLMPVFALHHFLR